jgi:uncharacterized damage-inducible protein DinB
MDVQDLVRYNLAVRYSYFAALKQLPWAMVVEPRGLSFDSARNVFLHLTLVEDRWINYTLQNRFCEWKDPDFEAFQNFDSVETYLLQVKAATDAFLKTLNPSALERLVVVPWGKTPKVCISVESALCHMVMEDMIHYGELSAFLLQANVTAPYLPFWRFKYEESGSS